MKTLIVYASKTGYTAECAGKIAGLLGGQTDRVDLSSRPARIDLGPYDRVIIGGPIRADRLSARVGKFCRENLDRLLEKKVGLFIACLTPADKADRYFDTCFPPALVRHARAKGLAGAAVYFDRMNPVERFIMKKITRRQDSFSAPNEQDLARFARAMK